ncbi:MAG TPA: hypothetical protein DDZ88_23230 [Verrucomicrobiales bacterium]|nr:hypothetical protein [Verrucomicrobiales bacterium]
MMIEKPLPPPSVSRAAAYAGSFALFAAVVVMTLQQAHELVTASSLIFGMVTFAFLYYRRRCPGCGGLLRFRRDYIGDSPKFRCIHDCSQCGIAWCRDDIGDDSQT